ncbi:MAG: tryptophan synthase subunit alpha [Candidatus Omnitrophota bacterium]|nr:tryptophan synthase subunit alpha [Candidatus Omnitrophota bacterium]
MERIRATFDQLRRRGRTALIPFIMGGDPDLVTTAQLLLTLEDAGADLIEVGIPFSDPLADGPVLQAASARALARGVTPPRVLAAVASVRGRMRIPVVCLSYWNLLLQFGQPAPKLFLRAARRSGVSGLIVPDLPVEEGAALRQAAKAEGVAAIFLAAPTSPPERLRAIARASEGFIYYVSVTGTTGARRKLPADLAQGVRQLRLVTTKPICIGFGISTPAQAAMVARVAEGVIVGSALVQRLHRASGRSALMRRAASFIRQMRQAL